MARDGWIGTGIALVAAGGLLAWNLADFLTAEPKIRMTDRLDFLPEPEVAKVLSFGHAGTLAKLRLIDSYTFFSYVLESRSDAVAGSDHRGGFERLYLTLIELDPLFKDFYLKGASAAGGIVEDHHVELRLLLRGLEQLPHDTDLWRYFLAVMATHYQLEDRDPAVLASLLSQWAAAEAAKPNGRPYLANDWLAALGRRQQVGAGHLFYWAQQLRAVEQQQSGSPYAEHLENRLRSELADYQKQRLQAVWEAAGEPADWSGVDSAAVQAAYQGASAAAQPGAPTEPMALGPDGSVLLRQDPFGHPWRISDAGPVSPGVEARARDKAVAVANLRIQHRMRREGRWPSDADEAREWAAPDVPMPEPIELHWTGEAWEITGEPEPPMPPWTHEDLYRAAGLSD